MQLKKKLMRGFGAAVDRVLGRPRPAKGERQVAATLDGIRPDHVARYRFAAGFVCPTASVLDIACGVGYGSRILADTQATATVLGVDLSTAAIDYAHRHYCAPNLEYAVGDALKIELPSNHFDLVVSFETIEHLAEAEAFLQRLKRFMKESAILVCSTPNEEISPFKADRYPFHVRHYRMHELEQMLNRCGYEVKEWHSQQDKHSSTVVPAGAGAFMIAVAGVQQERSGFTLQP